jgi:hypothetical protein
MNVACTVRANGEDTSGGWPATTRRRQLGRRIGAALIVGAAATALGLSVHHGVQVTAAAVAPASIAEWTTFDSQQACLYRAIRSELPKGASVYIADPGHFDAQRLAELSTQWAVPQPGLATSQWVISVDRGHACSGISLRVRGA